MQTHLALYMCLEIDEAFKLPSTLVALRLPSTSTARAVMLNARTCFLGWRGFRTPKGWQSPTIIGSSGTETAEQHEGLLRVTSLEHPLPIPGAA